MRSKLQKRSTGKTTVFQTLATYSPWKRYFFQNLTDAFFNYLWHIKLVIPKILFILLLGSFNFYFKISWLPPLPHQNKNFWTLPPPTQDFSEMFHSPRLDGGYISCYLNHLILLVINFLNVTDHLFKNTSEMKFNLM